MKTKLFDKEFLQGLAWGDDTEIEEVTKHIVDTSRWSVHYEMVFKQDGVFYRTYYSKGATESQDESPYEYDKDKIECTIVSPVEKMIIVYEPVAEEEEKKI